MQEIYAALILHESGQQINEDNVKKILSTAGANVDDAKIKALVASLSGVNIDEALKEAVSFTAQPTASHEKKEEKSGEEEAKKAEEAAAGLSSLFG
ncbi:MAG: 50S ribosomal protein L12 [Candidatus Aenigmatarchaeota archaeon]|nr:50S ribosomal protein L12 [Candidatus Aenigmarchaeota archaeon]